MEAHGKRLVVRERNSGGHGRDIFKSINNDIISYYCRKKKHITNDCYSRIEISLWLQIVKPMLQMRKATLIENSLLFLTTIPSLVRIRFLIQLAHFICILVRIGFQ